MAIVKDRAVIGYVPREYAEAWSHFVDGKNKLGQQVLVTARAWSQWDPGYPEPIIYLKLEIPDDPASEAAAVWRAAGLCIECGGPVERAGSRGSKIMCADHAAKRKARLSAEKARLAVPRVATYRCVECGDEYTDEESAELGRLYECTECGPFVEEARDRRSVRCPDCQRPATRIADLGCSGCSEGRVVRIAS